MKHSISIITIPLIFFMVACQHDEVSVVEGYKPLYISKDKAFVISSQPPKSLINPGKIYMYGSLIFINERGRGVHVIDNSQPSNPLATHFIQIPGNFDIAIRQNYMYADNYTDLVTIDIHNLSNVSVVHRLGNLYDIHHSFYPDFYRGYFECVDTSLGYVIGWEKAELINPQCRR
jgi:hypothetical protein